MNSKGSIADAYQFAIITEKAKYTYKSTTPILEIQRTGKPVEMYGSLTFINNADAVLFYNQLSSVVKVGDIIYGKIDRLSNSHHWSDDRVEPDIILDEIVLGDVKQLAILGIN